MYKINSKKIKRILRNIPLLGGVLVKINELIRSRIKFVNSYQYWDDRYKSGGSSGSGSYGRLSQFKAKVLNDFVKQKHIFSVIEWGCGDGNQLMLAVYPKYLGLDVSPTAINMCEEKFKTKDNYQFRLVDQYFGERSDLAVSLDVIYHLIEDDVFDAYMEKLFYSSTKYVIIYSYNFIKHYESPHEVGREFMVWVQENAPQWKLIEKIKNEFPYDPNDPSNTSQSDFYIFECAGA